MSWTTARLGEVTRVVSGSTPDSASTKYWGGTHVWVTPTDLGKLGTWKVRDSARRLTDAGVQSRGLPRVPANSIIMSSRAPIGHLAIADCDLYTNQGCKSFICSPRIDPEFLFFLLRHLMPAIRALGSGATFVEVSKSTIEAFEIPFPGLTEQRRIAARLKAALGAVKDAQHAAELQADETRALVASIYRQAFAEVVPVAVPPEFDNPPTGWRWMKLLDVARLESGHTPSRSRSDWWGGTVSWLSLTEIRALDGQWVKETQIKTNSDGIANSAARILPRATVCFSRTASVGFVTIMDRPMATSQDFANWVCSHELDPEFLMYALIRARAELRALATGATHKTIYMPTLEAFHICAPDRPMQENIVAHLKDQLRAAEQIRDSSRNSLADIEQLPSRLLAQALEQC